jgi:hypothetical protein
LACWFANNSLVLISFWIIVSTSLKFLKKTKQLIVKTKPKQFYFLLFAALLLYLIVFPLLTSLPIEANPTKK